MVNKNEKIIVPAKPAHTYGQWIPRTTVSKIFVCDCGAKYLKTRDRQRSCVACIVQKNVK